NNLTPLQRGNKKIKLECEECSYNYVKNFRNQDIQKIQIMEWLERRGKIAECYLCKRRGVKQELVNYGSTYFCTWEEKYAYQIYLDVANPSHNYTYEGREGHWLNSRRSAGNYITVNRSMTKRIYDYIAQGLQDLELLENLKEEQEDDEISDPEMPLLYSNNEERDFNQAIHDSLQTKTKSYQEYCREMQDKTNGQNTLCKQCLLVINLNDESTYINVANQMEQTIDPYHIDCYNEVFNPTQYCQECKDKPLQTEDEQSRGMCASCYTIKKGKAKEEAPKDYFFNEPLTTEQEILNEVLYNYPLRFEAMEKAIQKVEMENQLLRQQIDSEHLIGLYKEAFAIVQRARQEIKELKFPTEQQAFQEALQRGRSPKIKVTTTTTLEEIEIEEISLEDFQRKTQTRTNSAPPTFLKHAIALCDGWGIVAPRRPKLAHKHKTSKVGAQTQDVQRWRNDIDKTSIDDAQIITLIRHLRW
ncbi:3905_t:CDS:2, partial [Cetraspora pellucida]